MISLKKQPKPKVLSDHEQQWTKTLLDKLALGDTPTSAEKSRYRHPDIKAALINETYGKCAYCESPLLHIHHGDVEHIYPKSLDPAMTFEWGNLTLACEKCNQNKSNKDPLIQHIIDPYVENPSNHIHFAGSLAFPLGSVEGSSTRAILDLNRGNLVEQRKERLEKLTLILDSALRPGLPQFVKDSILDDLKSEAANDASPYAAMGRCFLQTVGAIV